MADPLTIGLAVAQTGLKIFGGMSANDAAKKTAERQARLTYFQRNEEIRREEKRHEARIGAARAGVYAGNLIETGTPANYVRALDMEGMRQIQYAKAARDLERRAIESGGQGVGDSLIAGGIADLFGVGAQLFTGGAQAAGPWGTAPGTVNDPFLNQAESEGAFDELF